MAVGVLTEVLLAPRDFLNFLRGRHMKEINFEMKQCPECKNMSVPADDTCLNCHIHFIKYFKDRSWVLQIYDCIIGGCITLLIFIIFMLTMDHFGFWRLK